MTGTTHLVFVYGTLMKGQRNHDRFLNRPGARFLGDGVTRDAGFRMVVTPSLSSPGRETPSVFATPQGQRLRGQLFAVDDACLADLDLLERAYRREPVALAGGQTAWVYLKTPQDTETWQDVSEHVTVDTAANAVSWHEIVRTP